MENSVENNKLIAEFMGYENVSKVNHHPIYKIPYLSYEVPNFDYRTMDTIDTFSPYFDDMKFHTDWNWLMEVVKKCRTESNEQDSHWEAIYYSLADLDISNVYTAVVKFIKRYNTQLK